MKAREIKAIASKVDGIITGIMHLMIASVGVGTPVLGINYKNKMEGLLKLTGIGSDNLLTAKILLSDKTDSIAIISNFLNELNFYREKLAESKIKIHNMAMLNFKDLNE